MSLCPCGAEAVVVDGPTRLCHTHARALDPAELYRMERNASNRRTAGTRSALTRQVRASYARASEVPDREAARRARRKAAVDAAKHAERGRAPNTGRRSA